MFLVCQRSLLAGMSGWRCLSAGPEDGGSGNRCGRQVGRAAADPPFVYLIRSSVIGYTTV